MSKRYLHTLCLVAAAGVMGLGSGTALAQDEIFVTNFSGNSVTVYTRTASGNVAPVRTVVGAATGLLNPLGMAVDPVNSELFVVNNNGTSFSVTVYALSANGNVAPLRTIAGAATGLNNPVGIAVDPVNNEVIVANVGPSAASASITVYSRTANGNVAPLRTIAGAGTGLSVPQGLALDVVNNEIVTANGGTNSVTVHARTANGNVAPLRTIVGASTTLSTPTGVSVDTVNNEIAVGDQGSTSVAVFARTANGNVAPLRTITGGSTGLSQPFAVAVDPVNNELVVANLSNNSITVHARTANGNTAPLRTITGGATGLASPSAVAEVLGGLPPPTATPTATTTPGANTPTPTPTLPVVSPTPGGTANVPTLDARGLVALSVLLAAIGALAIRKMTS